MQRTVILILCMVGLLSCDNKTSRTEEDALVASHILFQGEDVDSLSLADRVADISFLALENNDSALIYEADKIRFENGLIYFGDFYGNKVVVYDETGKYRFSINKRGQGPDEYLEIKSFTVDSQYVYVLDNYNHKVFMYDAFDGSFRQEKSLPLVAWDIEALDNGHFLLAYVPLMNSVNMSHTNHQLFVVDSNFQIVKRLLPYAEEEKTALAYHTFFSLCDDDIIFASMLFDGYAVIPRSNVDSLYKVQIDFHHPVVPEHRKDTEEINKHSYEYLVEVPVVCGDYAVLQVPFEDYVNMYVYDRRDKKLMCNRFSDCRNALYFPVASYKGRFVSYLSDFLVYEDLVKAGFKQAPSAVEEQFKHEGSMLIFYTMR